MENSSNSNSEPVTCNIVLRLKTDSQKQGLGFTVFCEGKIYSQPSEKNKKKRFPNSKFHYLYKVMMCKAGHCVRGTLVYGKDIISCCSPSEFSTRAPGPKTTRKQHGCCLYTLSFVRISVYGAAKHFLKSSSSCQSRLEKL